MLPRRIAVVIGIPISRSEFEERIGQSDWLRNFATSNGQSNSSQYGEFWHETFEPNVSLPFEFFLQKAAAIGAVVLRRAGLSDLREATQRADVVILVSHWKGPEFSIDDLPLPIDLTAFRDRVTMDTSPLGRWLLEQFDRNNIEEAQPHSTVRTNRLWRRLRSRSQPKTLREILSASLRDPTVRDDESLKQGADTFLEADLTRQARRRDLLDQLFHDLVQPGNRLELFDGMHDKAAVEQSIDADFTGTLDFTTCTSTFLADYVAYRRRHKLRTVQFDTTQEPGWAARCLELTLSYWSEGKRYQVARAEAAEAMTHLVRMIEAERNAAKGTL